MSFFEFLQMLAPYAVIVMGFVGIICLVFAFIVRKKNPNAATNLFLTALTLPSLAVLMAIVGLW